LLETENMTVHFTFSTFFPSHNCLILLWRRINSTSWSGWKIDGKDIQGKLFQYRYLRSLEM